MICPKCNVLLPDGAKFCSQCGAPGSAPHPDGSSTHLGPEALSGPALPPLSPLVQQACGLRAGERTVQLWRAGQVESSTDPEESDTTVPVLLVATDQRMIVLREKGLMTKTYRPTGSFEYKDGHSYDLTSLLRIKRLVVHTQGRWTKSRTEFANLCEADPATLRMVAPVPVERTKALLDGLIGKR